MSAEYKTIMNEMLEMKTLADDFMGKAEAFIARQKSNEEILSFCAECDSPDISEVGDVTYCEECKTIEGSYICLTKSEAERRGWA